MSPHFTSLRFCRRPRSFEIEFSANLNEALQALNITAPFTGGDLTKVGGSMLTRVGGWVLEKVSGWMLQQGGWVDVKKGGSVDAHKGGWVHVLGGRRASLPSYVCVLLHGKHRHAD